MIMKSIPGRMPVTFQKIALFTTVLLFFCYWTPLTLAQETGAPQLQVQSESLLFSVVVVNPSDAKPQTALVKENLPIEVTPEAILDPAGLEVKFDEASSFYYLYKESVELKPGETKVFKVKIRDVWIIPQNRLDSLKNETQSVIEQLGKSEFHEPAKRLGEAIYKALKTVADTQSDTAVSRKDHIILYRNNLKIVDQAKKNISKLRKQLEPPQVQAEAKTPKAPPAPVANKKDIEPKPKPKKGFLENIIDTFPGLFKK